MKLSTIDIVNKLKINRDLNDEEFSQLLLTEDEEALEFLRFSAVAERERNYGKKVYIRGLIEFTSYCKNNCHYCGIRCGNPKAERYRLSGEQILECCKNGYALGFRTFVLQGGEDPYFTDDRMVEIVSGIKKQHPDCAVTLSIGERERESYERFFAAGADRYLLRHETADPAHYQSLHPKEMSYEHRLQCLKELKEIGFQVGCGMMIGSPGQKTEHLIADLRLIQRLEPQMVGMGPFIPHKDTVFANEKAGSAKLTLRLISILRLMQPKLLIPATTALGTVDPSGREKGLLAGANVLMPNLSPTGVRDKYALYDNKICTGEEAAECIRCLSLRVSKSGYEIVTDRGDAAGFLTPASAFPETP